MQKYPKHHYYNMYHQNSVQNTLIITRRDPWFMETFMKYKQSIDKVIELCFQPDYQEPFPYEKYQKLMCPGPYPGFKKALTFLPPYGIAPFYSNILIMNTESVRLEGDMPYHHQRETYLYTTYPMPTKHHPEMRKFLMKHRYWLKYLRMHVWNHKPMNFDCMLLNGKGYRSVMKIIKYKKPYEEESEFAKEIYMTEYLYHSFRADITLKKEITDELLKIKFKHDR